MRVSIDIRIPNVGTMRIALSRVPCVGERVTFHDSDRKQWFRLRVIGVEHHDPVSWDGADATLGVVEVE